MMGVYVFRVGVVNCDASDNIDPIVEDGGTPFIGLC